MLKGGGVENDVRGSTLAGGVTAVLVNWDVDVQLLEVNHEIIMMPDIRGSSSDRPW